jgi:serine/threonine protein kinase
MTNGLTNIHNADVIHKDYHSGNIFIGYFVITGDLGISKSAIDDDSNEIYGIIPYVAPEVFQGHKYTKASDIYSLGMVMWELMTGRRPFWNQKHDTDLIIKISDGLRPPIVTNAPKGYVEIMEECWHSDPKKRPTATSLGNKILDLLIKETNNKTEIVRSSDIGPTTIHSGAIYRSRSLSTMIKSAESSRSLKSQRIISKPGNV